MNQSEMALKVREAWSLLYGLDKEESETSIGSLEEEIEELEAMCDLIRITYKLPVRRTT